MAVTSFNIVTKDRTQSFSIDPGRLGPLMPRNKVVEEGGCEEME